jgi:mevalonate kinase
MRLFPAKLLLFGEYSVLAGSGACAFPYPGFSGSLVLPGINDNRSPALQESNRQLKKLATYLNSLKTSRFPETSSSWTGYPKI